MRLLLDTNMLLWSVASPGQLSTATADLISDSENSVEFSPISIWEIAIKFSLGRDDFTARPDAVLRRAKEIGFIEHRFDAETATAVAWLPFHHHDPFDRMLVAQAMRAPMHFLTSDQALARYSELVMVMA